MTVTIPPPADVPHPFPQGGEKSTVAALFVQTGGEYFGLDGVDPWDEARDARLYAGPWPVVAHPPCNTWARLAPADRRGHDGGCFESALRSVRAFGGVLEQPADSFAWKAFDLPTPCRHGWVSRLFHDGWTCEVDQHAYGFLTRKRTWLYYVGPEPTIELRSAPDAGRGCERLWSTARSTTPPEFRDVLLSLARATATIGRDALTAA